MPSMPQLRLYFTIIQIVSYSLVLMNLFRSGLWRRYRYFCLYIAFEMLRVPTMLAIPFRSQLYGRLFFATQPIAWILFVLVVLELFQLVLRNHAGIATLGKKALTWSLVLSVVISGATLLIELQEIRPESAFLVNFILLDRLVMSSLL